MTDDELLLLWDDTPAAQPLPRLIASGQFFVLETGELFTAVECSDFNLFGRFVKREDIEPVLDQREAAGFNTLRVWSRYAGNAIFEQQIGRLLPSEHPDLYDRLPAFFERLSAHRMYGEVTAYTGGSREGHWERLGGALQGVTNVLGVELINEGDSYSHQINVSQFSKLPGLLCSHGSNGAEHWPVMPHWDYATFHTNGAYEEQRKVGHNAWEIWDGPTLTNETSRYPDVGMWANAPLARQEQLAFDSAAGAALLCAGSCFHSRQGKNSTLWDTAALTVATAWAAGARSVDRRCQAGPYLHRIDLEDPGELRVYERPVAGLSCVVTIRT